MTDLCPDFVWIVFNGHGLPLGVYHNELEAERHWASFTRLKPLAEPCTLSRYVAEVELCEEREARATGNVRYEAEVLRLHTDLASALARAEAAETNLNNVQAYLERTQHTCGVLAVAWTNAEVMEMVGQIVGLLKPVEPLDKAGG